MVVVGLLGGVWGPPAHAGKTLQFGIHSPGEGYFGASLKSGFEAGGKSFAKRTGLSVKYLLFKDLQAYYGALQSGQVDITFSVAESVFLRASETGRYTPVAAYEVFGQPRHQYCLHVPADSPVKNVKELKGKTVITYEDEWSYLQLTDLVGERPEQFFGRMDITPGGTSSAYGLSLKQTDAALISTAATLLMKVMNPGPLKKIRQLACGPAFPLPPLMVKKTLSQTLVKESREELLSVRGNPAYASVQPLLARLNLRFKPVNPKDYVAMLNRFAQARKSGALAHYSQWIKIATRRK